MERKMANNLKIYSNVVKAANRYSAASASPRTAILMEGIKKMAHACLVEATIDPNKRFPKCGGSGEINEPGVLPDGRRVLFPKECPVCHGAGYKVDTGSGDKGDIEAAVTWGSKGTKAAEDLSRDTVDATFNGSFDNDDLNSFLGDDAANYFD
jgi:hypothetical protein